MNGNHENGFQYPNGSAPDFVPEKYNRSHRGAAVTAIIARDKSMGADDKVHFTLDRPFSFFIHTTASEWTGEKNVIMFEGEIVE